MSNLATPKLLTQVVSLALQAGERIMSVYESCSDVEVVTKADDSPLTKADIASHCVLEEGLLALTPGVPIISEESNLPSFNERREWGRYWLIDPLDGTKEFINHNGEFTVNVALIEQGVAVLGVVVVPVTGVVYTGLRGSGASKQIAGLSQPIQVRTLESRVQQQLAVEVVASRRHGAEATRICPRR